MANGASLGNNRQSNEHSEMAHLIGPFLTIYRYSDRALLLLPRTTQLSDIIEPQSWPSLTADSSDYNYKYMRSPSKTLHLPIYRVLSSTFLLCFKYYMSHSCVVSFKISDTSPLAKSIANISLIQIFRT